MSNKADAGMQAIHQRNLELAAKMAQMSFENARKIIELQVNLARELFEDGLANAKDASSVTDPAEALQVRSRLAQKTAERMLGVTREIAGMTANAQAEFGKIVGQQLTGGSDLTDAMQQAFKGAGFNPTDAMAVAQNAFDAARGMYEQIAKVSMDALSATTQAATRKGK